MRTRWCPVAAGCKAHCGPLLLRRSHHGSQQQGQDSSPDVAVLAGLLRVDAARARSRPLVEREQQRSCNVRARRYAPGSTQATSYYVTRFIRSRNRGSGGCARPRVHAFAQGEMSRRSMPMRAKRSTTSPRDRTQLHVAQAPASRARCWTRGTCKPGFVAIGGLPANRRHAASDTQRCLSKLDTTLCYMVAAVLGAAARGSQCTFFKPDSALERLPCA